MNFLVKNLLLFTILLLSISLFASCGSRTATPSKETSGETNEENTSKDDGYPPPPEAIANANFELIDGESFNLKEAKGKVVLINLWAIWCGPCIQEMPHLNEMQEKYKDKGFVVLGLNTGNDYGAKEKKGNIDKFVERQKLNYSIGWSERSLTEEFFRLGRMNGIPQSFLINRDGKLTGIFQGGGPKVITQMKENVEKVVNAS